MLLATAVLVFGPGTIFAQVDRYVLFFDDSVKGLSVGAPVIFKGVKIGNVSKISLISDPQTRDILIAVIIDVELSRVVGAGETLGYPDYRGLIKQGYARLEVQSFITGQLMLAFDFYPDKPVKMYGIIKSYPELPALPISPDIFEVMDDLPIKEISFNLEQTAAGINRIVNSGVFDELNVAIQEMGRSARSLRLFLSTWNNTRRRF